MEKEHLSAKIGQYGIIESPERKVLILERARSKTWSLPGGRLNQGEKWNESLLREIFEETGVECSEPKPIAVNVITDPYQVKYCVYFKVDTKNSSGLSISSEHSNHKWVGNDDLDQINFEDNQIQSVLTQYFSSK